MAEGAIATPTVSVCIPVFNGEAYIGPAIRSVLEQTHGAFELVVCDNASTDATLAVVRGFEDVRIRVVESDSNIGAGANWNRCLSEARCDNMKILCADDVLLPEALERQLAVLQAPENRNVTIVCGRRYIIDAAGVRRLTRGLSGEGRIAGRLAVRKVVRSGGNPIGESSSVLFRRSVALEAGGFAVDSPYVVDVDMWVRMLMRGDLYVLPGILSEYRVSGSSWSVGVANRQASDYREMIEAMRTDGRYGISPFDARLGITRSWLNAQLRRLFYARFASSGGSRP